MRVRAAGLTAAMVVMVGAASAAAAEPARPAAGAVEVTVEPWTPGEVPTSAPVVDLTVACQRNLPGGRREVVFGYEHRVGGSRLVRLVESDGSVDQNVIIRQRPGGPATIDPAGPQVALFLPGSQPAAFAVALDRDETVTWQVQVPAEDEYSPTWRSTVRVGGRLSQCRGDVPDHFAVVQTARVATGPTDIVRDESGGITAWSVGAEAVGIGVACSEGGRPVAPRSLVGWVPDDERLAPLESVDYVLQANGVSFDMSSVTARPVLDVTAPYEFFGPPADVFGRCAFGRRIVESEPFWAGEPQTGRFLPQVEAGVVVDFVLELELPGGVRIR